MKTRSNLNSWMKKGLAVTIAGAALLVASCCPKPSESGPGVFRIIAVDTSGSAEPDLVKYRRFAFKLVHELEADQDAVRVLRFDFDAYEILSNVGQRKEALLGTLAAQLKVPAERPCTRMAKLYERIAELLNSPEAKGRQIEIYIFADNGNDDASQEMARLCEASAAKIATNPQVSKISYWGVKTRLREEIPSAFSKLPPGVLSVQFNSEAFATR